MVYHGYNGFRDIAKNILDCSQKLKNTLSSISDVEIMGDAMLNIITFTTKNINGNILYNELA